MHKWKTYAWRALGLVESVDFKSIPANGADERERDDDEEDDEDNRTLRD